MKLFGETPTPQSTCMVWPLFLVKKLKPSVGQLSYINQTSGTVTVSAANFATITIIASINALVQYNNACFGSFYEGNLGLTLNGTVPTNPNDAAIDINFDWKMGPGLACLYAGTILKLIDV